MPKIYKTVYVPKKARDAVLMLHLLQTSPEHRHILASDIGKQTIALYIVSYKGSSARRSLQGIALCICDIGNVGEKFADVWIKSVATRFGDPQISPGPIRFAIAGDRVYY